MPFLVWRYGVGQGRKAVSALGWSVGGPCAVGLTVMHLAMFTADIAGITPPILGRDKKPSIFGGSGGEWSRYDQPRGQLVAVGIGSLTGESCLLVRRTGRVCTRCGHQNQRPRSAAIDGVMNERTISVSNSRPSPIVVPT